MAEKKTAAAGTAKRTGKKTQPAAATAAAGKSAAKRNAPAAEAAADAALSAAAETAGVQSGSTPVLSAKVLWQMWLDGWKKIFTLRGRTSRFELWCWLVPNTFLCVAIQLCCTYVLSPRFLRTSNALGFTIGQIESFIAAAQAIFYLVAAISLFPLGSLLIRRMHDLNRLAWKDYLEPVFMGTVVFSALNFAVILLSNTAYAYTILLLGICMVAIFYGLCFHLLKFLIMTLFYRGNFDHNLYGAPKYKGDEYEEPTLDLSCVYFLLIATVGALYLALALV